MVDAHRAIKGYSAISKHTVCFTVSGTAVRYVIAEVTGDMFCCKQTWAWP